MRHQCSRQLESTVMRHYCVFFYQVVALLVKHLNNWKKGADSFKNGLHGKREQILLRMDPILEGIVFPREQTGSHTCDSCCPLKIMAENRKIHSSYMLHVFMYMMKYCTYLLDIRMTVKPQRRDQVC